MTTDEIMALAAEYRLATSRDLDEPRAALRAAVEQLVAERDRMTRTGIARDLRERLEKAEARIAELERVLADAQQFWGNVSAALGDKHE